MALFRLIDHKEEFLEAYGKLLALRLLTGITRIPCNFERDLLSEFKNICGPLFVKSFEKMFSDLNERELSVTILTGGTWNIRGKLLPGHAALLSANEQFNWPQPLETEILKKSQFYQQKYPKRKLFWSPLLTSIEFSYVLGDSVDLMIKGSCLHLNILQLVSETRTNTEEIVKLFGQFSLNCLNSLITTNLITKSVTIDGTLFINENFKQETKELDLYTLTLTELLCGKTATHSTCSTPLPSSNSANSTNYFSNTSQSHQSQITPIDKSILLQCAITRILKQLRVLALSDLFNRISMLPKLLTRFSPTVKDLLDALKQLHEKEFVKLAFGDGIDDLIDATDDDLINIQNDTNTKLFIKYLA